jgi:cytochrome b
MSSRSWPGVSGRATGSQAAQAPASPVLVWDLPVRLTHWLMVLSFAGAWLTAEGERWRLVHVTLGYTLAGLVAFRLAWGLLGTRHARFASFVRGPAAAWAYLRGLMDGHAPHYTGHNPAGALAIVALLGFGVLTTGLGWALDADLGGHLLEEAHELAAQAMLAVVGVHLLGVLVGSLAHRENLVRAMFTGRKRAPRDQAIGRAWSALAALILIFVVSFWAWQWQSAPAAQGLTAAQHGAMAHEGDDDDD